MPGRLREILRKPAGRAGSHPRHLEIVVARTGYPAHTFRINLDSLRRFAGVAGGVAALWLGGTFYVAYSHVSTQDVATLAHQQAERIAALESRNEALLQEKRDADRDLFDLRGRVERLAARVHGLVGRAESQFPAERAPRPQGGVALPVDGPDAERFMQAELSRLDDGFDDLLPELERTLEREIARPVGIPVAGVQDISSRYGVRGNPFGSGREFHNGVDFVLDIGTPILATAPGRVISAGYEGPNGNRVSVDHGYGYRSVYAHLSAIEVKPGDEVQRGQVVGLSGNTGRSSGPHLHYTLYYRGQTVDPARYLKTP
ncbi:MAG TPA: M23 family metallopeptidase [Thiobacillaceae bacterium]|nr:M23 family metallopeptidase [Thiobacillaceae bacterium]